jgi:hypothetical protein
VLNAVVMAVVVVVMYAGVGADTILVVVVVNGLTVT